MNRHFLQGCLIGAAIVAFALTAGCAVVPAPGYGTLVCAPTGSCVVMKAR